MSIFTYIRKKKEHSAWQNNQRRHQMVDLASAQGVLILFDYDDLKEITPIVQELAKHRRKIHLWTSSQEKDGATKIYDSSGHAIRVVTADEQSKFNIISSSVLKEFRLLNYDFAINFSQADDDVLQYLSLNVSSNFFVGLKKCEYPVYDFVYLKTTDQTFSDTFDDIKNYLGRYVEGSK